MNASGKKRFCTTKYGEAPVERHISIADVQLKVLLDKQLQKQVNIKESIACFSKFTDAVVAKDDSVNRAGSKTLSEFQTITETEERTSKLREYGLTDDEIILKIRYDNGEINEDKSNWNEYEYENKFRIINKKMKDFEDKLSKEISYSNMVVLNRKEYETEKSLHVENSNQIHSFLVKKEEKVYPENDPVLQTLREYESQQAKKRKHVNSESESDDESKFVGPLLSNVNERVEPIPVELIFRNRASLTEIRDIERFKNYKAGVPFKTLFIKNLSRTVHEKDLAHLFSRYYIKNESNVEYKIMTGRMKGQAFVSFKDEKTAMEALLLCNGYRLKDKPIIIEYGRPKI